MKNKSTPHIFILGLQDNFRGESLVDELAKADSSFEIHWAKKVYSQDIVNQDIIDSRFAKFAIGREIKCEEISCANGHNEIYKKIFEKRLQWSIILEDDVEMIDELDSVNRYLFETEFPSIIFLNNLAEKVSHLNETGKSEEKKQTGIVKQFLPKNIACSYAINFAAVKVINELGHNQLISSPDWPYRWSPRVDFYQCVSPIFVHPPQGENSLIGERSNNREKILNRIPNPIRLFRALMYNIPFDVAFKKEISFKCKLLFRQLRYKIGAK
jgi:hypothetical protein